MNVFIAYDVPSTVDALFKSKMKEVGYGESWASNDKIYKLPKNTLWKPNTTLEQAYNDSVKCVKEANGEFDRLIIVPATPWIGIQGK